MVREQTAALNDYPRIYDVLAQATERLNACSESPRLDAELLLALALDVPRSYLFAHPEDLLDPAASERFFGNVEKRRRGTPLAYIIGEKEFWSMRLLVGSDTLVPRPETEILVEQALQRIPLDAEWQLLDLGTGTGAIALAIARERPLCRVFATDVSPGALRVARENARRLAVPNVAFVCADWCAPFSDGSFDLVVSNPPYVEEADRSLEALCGEPRLALASGPDGLEAMRLISRQAGPLLRGKGALLLEHGDRQADAVAGILEACGWRVTGTARDLAGLPRVTVAQR